MTYILSFLFYHLFPFNVLLFAYLSTICVIYGRCLFIFFFCSDSGSQKLCPEYDQWGIPSWYRGSGELIPFPVFCALAFWYLCCHCVLISVSCLIFFGFLCLKVISARKGEFETGYERGGQTREHVLLAKTLGVAKLLVVVNKMDDHTVQWSKERCF